MVTKFDDLGNALLHALDEILCGSSNYRPLIPATPTLHVNRSVILTILPDHIYWLVLQCKSKPVDYPACCHSATQLPRNIMFGNVSEQLKMATI